MDEKGTTTQIMIRRARGIMREGEGEGGAAGEEEAVVVGAAAVGEMLKAGLIRPLEEASDDSLAGMPRNSNPVCRNSKSPPRRQRNLLGRSPSP